MRISDWSSDVCSSDLAVVVAPVGAVEAVQAHRSAAARGMDEAALADIDADVAHVAAAAEEHQVRRGQALGGDARHLVGGEGSRGARQLEVEHVAVDVVDQAAAVEAALGRSAEHTSDLQSLIRTSYAVFCLNKKKQLRHK